MNKEKMGERWRKKQKQKMEGNDGLGGAKDGGKTREINETVPG